MNNDTPFGLVDEATFLENFETHVKGILEPIGIRATVSTHRIAEAFQAWKNDLERNKEFNFKKRDTSPDHFKSAAHLTYWIRRLSPIVNLATSFGESGENLNNNPQCQGESEGGGMYSIDGMIDMELDVVKSENAVQTLTELKKEHLVINRLNQTQKGVTVTAEEIIAQRRRIFGYANEFVAFDYGYRQCMKYEKLRLTFTGPSFWPDIEFIDTICYFLKFKNVSPHAIVLIYKSLLMNRFVQN